MPRRVRFRLVALAGVLAVATAAATPFPSSRTPAPSVDLSRFTALHWRPLGPFSPGRTTAAAGTAATPPVFYVGVAGAGLWKTDDYGQSWQPVFDAPPGGLVGAVAVAASNPDIVYAGTGEVRPLGRLTAGSGLYRSADGGRHWLAVGLATAGPATGIAIDPATPDHLLVAVPAGPAPDRGVLQSADGGRTFTPVLPAGPGTAGVEIRIAPDDPRTVYAALWRAPGADPRLPVPGGGSGIFKSADGGATWQRLAADLPALGGPDARVVALAVAPRRAGRIFAAVGGDAGPVLYRSDDAGATWAEVSHQTGLASPSSAVTLAVDPTDADHVYLVQGDVWYSADAGRTFGPWKGAPASVDSLRLWVNPANPGVMLLESADGATITVNDGRTWSSRFTQPTADVWSVSVDDTFPYRVCGSQSGQGAWCVASRREGGTPLGPDDATRLPAQTTGPLTPDPTDRNILYGGDLFRFDRETGQAVDISPVPGGARAGAVPPVVFAPDRRTMFFASRGLWKSTTGGQSWSQVTPSVIGGADAGDAASAISTFVISPLDPSVMWAGTASGGVRLSRDGGSTWTTATAPIPSGTHISSLAASHFDPASAYLVADLAGGDDPSDRVLRTRDGGATWTSITRGLPQHAAVHVVREDPYRRGLLFAGTDQSIYCSFDDGDTWQSLQLDLPATPVRDLAATDGDLVVATGGRGFWVLDDIFPLRQVTPDVEKAAAFLFRPAVAWRERARPAVPAAHDAPTLPDAPAGATLTYLLGTQPTEPLALEIIRTASGDVIRRYSSVRSTGVPDALLADPSIVLPTSAGLHRVVWDLRYAPVPADEAGPAIPGPMVLPGTYQVRLTIGGRPIRQAVVVRMDPRVRVALGDLSAQLDLARSLDEAIGQVARVLAGSPPGPNAATAAGRASHATLVALRRELGRLLGAVEQADARPSATLTATANAAVARARATVGGTN